MLLRIAVVAVAALSLSSGFVFAEEAAHQLQLLDRGEVLIDDQFTKEKLKGRRMVRGDWQLNDGVASCLQDEELYIKYKNHGPIIRYAQDLNDAIIEFDMKANKETTNVVFTLNGKEGHIYRVLLRHENMVVVSFDENHKSQRKAFEKKGFPADAWIPVTIEVAGDKSVLQVGDFEPIAAEDAAIAQPKSEVTLGFAHGKFEVRNIRVTAGEPR
ncbi:hypothetical protein [Calycomorphotria hydatis]|uniref:3-keto-disaccharide hydrolase domain-containing protein n=1 Tax=Calycomorphotria hydatis TaxID=2528027 RepID=A0A517TAV9_9PLAN|nr:hypothetical protein [Calycomorphotria hydatis]QDT65508.1 hypothetical protein V22_27620 [Calycomorphotria hydatis]